MDALVLAAIKPLDGKMAYFASFRIRRQDQFGIRNGDTGPKSQPIEQVFNLIAKGAVVPRELHDPSAKPAAHSRIILIKLAGSDVLRAQNLWMHATDGMSGTTGRLEKFVIRFSRALDCARKLLLGAKVQGPKNLLRKCIGHGGGKLMPPCPSRPHRPASPTEK